MTEQNPDPIRKDDSSILDQEAELLGLAPLSIPTEEAELLGLAPFQLFESPAKGPPPAEVNGKKPGGEG